MATNPARCWLICLSIGIIVCFLIAVIISLIRPRKQQVFDYGSCLQPKQYATDYDFDYTKSPNEYRNTNSPIDYFRLSLSWAPTFCMKNNFAKNFFQCQHSFGFIVHGLWPSTMKKGNSISSHPRNCRNEKPMPIKIIKRYFCIMPSEHLMQAEWEKHGTCYWKIPEDYFQQIYSLYSKIHLPNNVTMDTILNGRSTSRSDSIRKSFLNLNPQLKSTYIDVIMTDHGKTLNEVAFCYDHNFNNIDCNKNI